MTEDLAQLHHIKSNYSFTVEDINRLLREDYYLLPFDVLECRAKEIYRIIHCDTWAEWYNNKKETKARDDTNVEFIGMIEPQRLVEIDEDLRKTLTDEHYQIYKMIKDKCEVEFILGWTGLKRRKFYYVKKFHKPLIFF